jgi:hypothetical protein
LVTRSGTAIVIVMAGRLSTAHSCLRGRDSFHRERYTDWWIEGRAG